MSSSHSYSTTYTNGDNDTSAAHQSFACIADSNGNINSYWVVPPDQDELGATLKLTADGQSSLLHAEATFTDANFTGTWTSVTPSSTCAGATASYTLIANNPTSSASDAGVAVGKKVVITFPSGFTLSGFTSGTLNGTSISSGTITTTATTVSFNLKIQMQLSRLTSLFFNTYLY